jgi:hypothetical protein
MVIAIDLDFIRFELPDFQNKQLERRRLKY